MPHPRLRGLLFAACLPLLFAACGSEGSSTLSTPDALSAAAAAKGVQVAVVSGGGQSGAPGQPLSAPVVVRVTDAKGQPLAEQPLLFNPGTNADADVRTTRTDKDGYARAAWTLGPELGTQTMRVSVTGGAVTVTANAQRGGGTRIGIVKRRGEEQVGAAGTQLPLALQASIVRDDGKPVPGAVVTFTVNDGGRVNRPAAKTGVDGIAYVLWTLGPIDGPQTLTAVTPGAPPVIFTATATGGTQRNAGVALVVRPDSLVLDVGATGVLTASLDNPGQPQLPGQAPRWSTSDPTVATVDNKGTVRGIAPGMVVVTATLGSHSAFATVRVRGRSPATLQLVPDSLVLDVDGTGTLTAVVRDASGAQIPGQAPTWSSSAPAVATVDAQGQVRGVSAGTAQVTATLGALSASATVRVRPRGPSLQIFPDSLVLDIGVWAKVYPVARDASGKAVLVDYVVQWSTSSDQVVFPFADGSLLPIAAGTARITARWGNLTTSIPVRVRPPRVTPLSIPQIQMRAGYAPKYEASTRALDTNWWIHVSQRNVSALSMRIRGPSGRTIACTNSGPENIYGNEFRCDLTFPRGSEPGVWKVDQVTVTKDGRTTTFTAADLEAQGTLGRAIDLFGTGPDTQAPVVRVIWPHQGTRYPDIYYVNLGVLDHVSGLRSARMTVRGPGGVTHTCEVNNTTSGLCRLPLRPGSGTWDIVSVEAEDNAGNRATYTAQQIAQLASGMNEAPFLVYSFTP